MCVTDKLSPTDREKLMNAFYPTDIPQLAAEALLQKVRRPQSLVYLMW